MLLHASTILMYDTSVLITMPMENNADADGKQFEKASLSLKYLSDMITWVFDHASLYLLKTSTIDYMTVLVSSAKINKATISLKPSLPTISSKYTSIQLICTWHQPTKFLVISQTSHSCINLDKIVIWSSFPSRLVPRFEIGQDTKTFAYIFLIEYLVQITRL